ncbi:putative P450 monooxygenase [Mytilinidion resinicola]|uniref:P450 monooxygenase n=1 Tax=Mytilinidion resinicola TaxID=574789 RepID=A0A6A6YKE3_9PEZI|nr:putative P450 monooxygenase [Mytilinidion resinicola]KAF2808444.1 putative P450 monooxygenase [Mytilinidion resinicola]
MALTTLYLLGLIAAIYVVRFFYTHSHGASSHHNVPGPWTFSISSWRLAYEDLRGRRTRTICQLHAKYGPVVRIGPNEVSFNSPSALRTIYGAGSGFQRTDYYRMFDAYGRQNLFSFASGKDHGERKKLVAHAYSKTVMLRGSVAAMVELKAKQFLELIQAEPEGVSDIFRTLHYYSIDNITGFLYGGSGATSALTGDESHRALLNDMLDPARRRLSWFAVHLPSFTKWLYSRSGRAEVILRHFLPMQKPAMMTGIRQHALAAFHRFKESSQKEKSSEIGSQTIIHRLYKHHQTRKPDGLDDMDIASECADHLLAGIDTTSDTLMFLIWALSLPQNHKFQAKLIQEVASLPESSLNGDGIPFVEAGDKLPYLNAVIKEALRLYTPLPATEPRSLLTPSIIDSFEIPAGMVVGIEPYSLHRNPKVFEDPLRFNPERWLNVPLERLNEMNRWWWAFSSGGRMCIGIHLAMSEMTTLVAAIYRKYQTYIAPGFENVSPGITSRFEMFYDELFDSIEEHECRIKFQPHGRF